MHKLTLSALVVSLLAGCVSQDISWSKERLSLNLKSGITVLVEGVQTPAGEELRFQGSVTGTEVKPSPYWRSYPGVNPGYFQKVDSGFSWKGILVTPTETGFTMSRNGTVLSEVEFQIDGKKFKVLTKALNAEKLYGFGGASDTLVLNGRSFPLYQKASYGNQNYINIPFYFSSGGDGFYINGTMGDYFNFGKDADSTVSVVTLETFVEGSYFWAPSPAELLQHFYTGQTAGTPPPAWAFGYIQSKYGYRSQEEVQEVIDGFEFRGVMPSALVLDLYWFKRMGDLDWDRSEDKFPDPEAMDKMLESKGVKLITISEPYFTEDSKNFAEWAKKGYFITEKAGGEPMVWESWWAFGDGGGSLLNLWAPGAAQTLGEKYVNMIKTGIDGFWTDLGEPEESPDEALYSQYTKKDVHNYYNREWSRIIHEAVTKAYPGIRPFILSRSGFTGSTKYGVSVWSGDVASSFKGLEKQTGIGLNLGLSGFPYFGSDVGGFESKGKPSDPELFTRWHQVGVFHPVYRAHGAAPREPWTSGPEAERRVLAQIKLRTQLQPYFYSLAWEAQKGVPMMAPLFYYYPEWAPAWNETEAFFSGPSFLVFPVTQPLGQAENRSFELPPGRWKTFPEGPVLQGGPQTVKLTLDAIPVFLREGAIVPRNLGGQLDLLVFPGEKSSAFTYYDDAAGPLETLKITLSGNKIQIEGAQKARSLTVTVMKETGAPQVLKLVLQAGSPVQADLP